MPYWVWVNAPGPFSFLLLPALAMFFCPCALFDESVLPLQPNWPATRQTATTNNAEPAKIRFNSVTPTQCVSWYFHLVHRIEFHARSGEISIRSIRLTLRIAHFLRYGRVCA